MSITAPASSIFLPARSADQLAAGFLGLMLSLPFLQPSHTLPLTSFLAEWLAILFGLLAMLAMLPRAAHHPLSLPSMTAAPLALLAIVLWQWAAGMFAYGASAALVLLYLAWSLGLMVAGRTLAASLGASQLLASLAWAMLAGALVGAACGLLQYLQWWPALGALVNPPADVDQYGVSGNLGQQNHFATHMALGMAAGGYLALTRRLAPRWLAVCALPLLAALALSGSRSSFLYLAWLLGATLVQLPRGTPDQARPVHLVRRLAIALLLLAAALAVAARVTPLGAQLNRLVSPDGALGPRLYLWEHALRMFASRPWLGGGFDSFAWRLIAQLEQPTRWGIDQYAHNLPLQLMAVAGLAGLLAVLIPALLLAHRLWRQPYSAERLLVSGVLGVLLIHSMLEQPLYYAYFLGIAALFAGLSDPAARTRRCGTLINTAGLALLGALLVLAIQTARDYRRMAVHFFGAGESSLNDAQRREFLQELRHGSLLAPLAELIDPAAFVPAYAPPGAKRTLNERMLHFAPTDEIAFRHAALLAEEGRPADAQAQFQRAAFAYPASAMRYLARLQALAAADAATYGALAAFGERLLASSQ